MRDEDGLALPMQMLVTKGYFASRRNATTESVYNAQNIKYNNAKKQVMQNRRIRKTSVHAISPNVPNVSPTSLPAIYSDSIEWLSEAFGLAKVTLMQIRTRRNHAARCPAPTKLSEKPREIQGYLIPNSDVTGTSRPNIVLDRATSP